MKTASAKALASRGKSGNVIITFLLYSVLAVTTFVVLYPVTFTIGAAFTKTNSLAATRLIPWPEHPSLAQFERLFTKTNYLIWYRNTFKIAVFNSLATLLVCVTSGYVFSRFRFRLRKPMMASMVILQMFPSFIGMIATYVILWRIGGLDTHWGLILVYVSGSIPFNTWLMKGYFDTVSKNIEEAARVDGASQVTTYVFIILPMVKPMITFLALTSFTGPWMDFIFPRLILRSNSTKTLAVGLFELINGRAADNFTMFAAGALLVAVPFAILFMAGQQLMLNSLAGEGVKE